LLKTLTLLTSTPPSWDRNDAEDDSTTRNVQDADISQISPEGVTRYLTSIVSSSLRWIENDEYKEEIWEQASMRLSERSGRTAMGAMSRKFKIPSSTGSFVLDIHEPALTGDDLGLKTWAASYMLAKRLHTFKLGHLNNGDRLQALELGSGTGLVGLAMAAIGTDVVLTDLPSIHDNLARNAQTNAALVRKRGGSTRTGILDWTEPTTCRLSPGTVDGSGSETLIARFPLILAADSLYSPEHPRMLVSTIKQWLSDNEDAMVIVEFPYREAYLPEIQDFRHGMTRIGLQILEEGEEQGYDDWGTLKASGGRNEDTLVTCWWSRWGRIPC
jgi:predicted nicotinamide N-methyase